MPILNSLGALKELLPAVGGMTENYWVDITPGNAMSAAHFDPTGRFRFITNNNKLASITDKNITLSIDQYTGTATANTMERITGTSSNEVLLGFHNSVSTPKRFGVAIASNGNIAATGFGFSSSTRSLALGNITIDTTGNYFLSGQGDGGASSSYGLLAKYNSSKSLLWKKAVRYPPYLPVPSYDYNVTVQDAISDGTNTYATGNWITTDGSNRGGFVFKTDSSGNMLWGKEIGYVGAKIALIDNNSNIIIGGYAASGNAIGLINKISTSTGAGVRAAQINNSTYANTITWVTSLNVDSTNNVVIGGQFIKVTGPPNKLNGYVIGLDGNLTTVRYKKDVYMSGLGTPQMSITSVAQVPNLTLYVSGLNDVSGAYTGMLLKTLYNGITIGTGNYVLGTTTVTYIDTTQLGATFGNLTISGSNIFLDTNSTVSIATSSSYTGTSLTITKLTL